MRLKRVVGASTSPCGGASRLQQVQAILTGTGTPELTAKTKSLRSLHRRSASSLQKPARGLRQRRRLAGKRRGRLRDNPIRVLGPWQHCGATSHTALIWRSGSVIRRTRRLAEGISFRRLGMAEATSVYDLLNDVLFFHLCSSELASKLSLTVTPLPLL